MQFVNGCLQELAEHCTELNNPGHQRRTKYDNRLINLWQHSQTWPCHDPAESPFGADVPLVRRRGGPSGSGSAQCDDYWCVFVAPYDDRCRHTYWVFLKQVIIELWLSVQVGGDGSRFLGMIDVRLDLQLWYNGTLVIPCNDRVKYPTPSTINRCAPPISGERIAYTTPDGMDYVPLTVRWRGLLGPQPWSKFESPTIPSLGFCTDIQNRLEDGVVIPGEVNDATDPDASNF